MKKFIQTLLFLMITIFSGNLTAQWACVEEVDVFIDPFTGTANIQVDDLIEGETSATLILSQSEFDCYDVGNSIQVEVSEEGSNENFCFVMVHVKDESSPIVVVDQDINIIIPAGEDEFLINPALIDEGSYDNCAIKEMTVEPASIGCSDIGSNIEVMLSVVDFSGNENIAYAMVYVDGSDQPEIECVEDFTMYYNTDRELDDFPFDRTEKSCANPEMVIKDGNGNLIEGNMLLAEHVGQTLQVILTNDISGNECTVNVYIDDFDCDPFLICDTECRSTPLSDCGSGHTNDDNVEWPCDLVISSPFINFEDSRPEELIYKYGVSEEDAWPVVFEEACYITALTFSDDYINMEDGVKIIRTWILLEWNTFVTGIYEQEIVFQGESEALIWNICDVASNSTENGDCFSGKTDTDDIEWPDDVAARDHRIRPEELEKISNLDYNDTRPILVANEEAYNLSYTDVIKSQTQNNILVERIWKVSSSFNSSLFVEYAQLINIPVEEYASEIVTVTTHGGRPVPGVEVAEGIFTDDLGVARVPGEIINPTLEDNPFSGIDMEDYYYIRKYTTASINLNQYELIASDIFDNDMVSTLDAVIIFKIVNGEYGPEEIENWKAGWRFEESSENSYAPVKASYIAYKYGDPSDSAPLGYLNELRAGSDVHFIFQDQLLNKGEVYTIQVHLDEGVDLFAYQMDIHTKGLQIQEVKSLIEGGEFNPTPIKEELIKASLVKEENGDIFVDPGQPILEIIFESLVNSTLSKHFDVVNIQNSFILTDDGEKLYIGKETEGEITSGIFTYEAIPDLKVNPNPVQDLISFDVQNNKDFNVDIFNANGIKVIASKNNQLNCTDWDNGIYFFRGMHDGKPFQGKFIIAH